MNEASVDPYDLKRFLGAQEDTYATAVSELSSGAKHSHWMWFVFPQVAGLGSSSMAQRYAIRSRAEAIAYLKHPVLGVRLKRCVEALLRVDGRSAMQIMGRPDDVKLCSSLTLFAEVAGSGSLFETALAKYFSGEKDQRTIDFLRRDDGHGA
jgi:uncharacterized protein (DUF1810 family)